MNIIVIMTKNSVSRKKRGNKTKRHHLRRNRSHGHGSSRQTRVKRGGMLRHLATSRNLKPNQIKSFKELNTFFRHNIVPLFENYEYHVTSRDPNPEDGNVVVYGERHYNSPIPKELTDEFNDLKMVIVKTKKDESNPVQVFGRVIDLYKKVKGALDEQKERNSHHPPPRPLIQGTMFPSSNRRLSQVISSNINASPLSPFRGIDLLDSPIVNRPFINSPQVSNIGDNSTPPRLRPKSANSKYNESYNNNYDPVAIELFPNSPNKTPPTTPLNSPDGLSTKRYDRSFIVSPVPMPDLSDDDSI